MEVNPVSLFVNHGDIGDIWDNGDALQIRRNRPQKFGGMSFFSSLCGIAIRSACHVDPRLAADIFAKHGEIAAKMKSAPGHVPSDFPTVNANKGTADEKQD